MAVTTSSTFNDDSGEARLSGTIGAPGATADNVLTADGAGNTSWAPGGGSSVTGSEYITGNNVTVANGDTADLTWDTKAEGDDLVDISTPSAPTIVATGVYAVTVIVQVGANMTAGGSYIANLGTTPDATQTAPSAVTANLTPTVSMTMVAAFTAGDALEVNVENDDGVQDLPFLLTLAHVERLG